MSQPHSNSQHHNTHRFTRLILPPTPYPNTYPGGTGSLPPPSHRHDLHPHFRGYLRHPTTLRPYLPSLPHAVHGPQRHHPTIPPTPLPRNSDIFLFRTCKHACLKNRASFLTFAIIRKVVYSCSANQVRC